jgi:hypothetical protein
MRIALVDNGSLEPAAYEGLRTAAARLSETVGLDVEAVSWRHSDRIPAESLGGSPALTLAPWIRSRVAEGERDFALLPYFVSPGGAIASLLRRDLDALRSSGPAFAFQITGGLDAGTDLAAILADHVRETLAGLGLARAPVVVVDHGGPSPASLEVRDRAAEGLARALGFGPVISASMEAPEAPAGAAFGPLLADVLGSRSLATGAVVIAPLFLSPGRHAGPRGDLARIAGDAERRSPGLRCHFTALVGAHPRTIEALASALTEALALELTR